MVNNNSNLLTVVWVAVIVAIVASIATASITGNTIKVKADRAGYNLYTKVEVDNLLNQLGASIEDTFNEIYGKEQVYTKAEVDELIAKISDLNLDNPNEISKCHLLSNGVLQKVIELKLNPPEKGKNITIKEGSPVKRREQVIIGGYLNDFILKATKITQASGPTYSSDRVELTDFLTGTTYDAKITSKHNGTIFIGGKEYTIYYNGTSSDDENFVTIDDPETTGDKRFTYDCW